MPLYVNHDLSPINQVRQKLAAYPAGITRRELMRELKQLSESSIDNAIFKLCDAGEAGRPKLGFLVATDRLKRMVPLAPAVAPEATPAAAGFENNEPVTLKEPEALNPDSEGTQAPIKFSIDSDGHLSIIDGKEILVLPPDATRRLGHFLGCFEPFELASCGAH